MRAFWKMHGLGNDFVVLDARADGVIPSPAALRRIADRHRGVGCDQLMILLPPTAPNADLFIRFFNADGSEPEACGNATRCAARLLFEENGKSEGIVQTIAGILPVWRAGSNAQREPIYGVAIARPVFDWDKIPLAQPQDTLWLDLAAGPLSAPAAVNVGNPHAVFFVSDAEKVDLALYGPQIERHPLFPQRINVEVCHILAPDKIRMRVWERGTGITQACGSGAAASLVAAARRGLTGRRAEILLDGGPLMVEWRDDEQLTLTGTASLAFTGEITADLLKGETP